MNIVLLWNLGLALGLSWLDLVTRNLILSLNFEPDAWKRIRFKLCLSVEWPSYGPLIPNRLSSISSGGSFSCFSCRSVGVHHIVFSVDRIFGLCPLFSKWYVFECWTHFCIQRFRSPITCTHYSEVFKLFRCWKGIYLDGLIVTTDSWGVFTNMDNHQVYNGFLSN